jgi:hypothetical protein
LSESKFYSNNFFPQATKFSAEHVDSRIEAFVDWFTDDKLANLSDEDFSQVTFRFQIF